MGLRSRRRRGDDASAADDAAIGEEHAWWAERDRLERVFVVSSDDETDTEDRGLGEFWSPESLFTYDQRTATDEPEPCDELADPYAALGLPPFSSWADVIVAHRKLVKRYHPDLMLHATDQERQEAEEHIRLVNRAYTQLQRSRRDSLG